jgi:hypothetical protein
MLDPTRRIALADCPGALVYADHAQTLRHYLVPSRPSLDVEDNGLPAARLLLFVKRQGDERRPSGGRISLTTVLRSSDTERARVEAALAALHGSTAQRIELVSPEWASGKVTVTLGDGLALDGTPALAGDNRCVLACALSAQQADALAEQWPLKLPGASIVYAMTLHAASTARRGVELRASASEAGSDARADASRTLQLELSVTAADRCGLDARGPLWLDGLERRLSELDL